MAAAVHARVGIRQFGGRGAPAAQVAGEEPKSGQILVEAGSLEVATPNPVKNHGGKLKTVMSASSGDLITNVPSGKYFDMDGTGGFPGIPAVSGNTDLDRTSVSGTGWLVDSLQTNAKVYNHAYFNNQIPKDTVITTIPNNTIDGSILESGGTLSYGYYWYRYDGSSSGLDLTISAPVNIGSRKVILLVDSASLYINGSINLSDGNGFFMASVGKTVGLTKGNIYINPSVGSGMPDLEGIYQADGIFNTGASTCSSRRPRQRF